MSTGPFILDLVAITLLTFGIYFPRHRRKDMLVAYLGVNVGVLAVANALSTSTIGAGLGLGLFGVLSIIRLRSIELDQQEVAYYFAALALGLLGGVTLSTTWLSPALMGTILAALYVADHPQLFGDYRVEVMTLDRAYTDEEHLTVHLESMLDARIHKVKIRKIDLVNDTTSVEVRYQRRHRSAQQHRPLDDRSVAL